MRPAREDRSGSPAKAWSRRCLHLVTCPSFGAGTSSQWGAGLATQEEKPRQMAGLPCLQGTWGLLEMPTGPSSLLSQMPPRGGVGWDCAFQGECTLLYETPPSSSTFDT